MKSSAVAHPIQGLVKYHGLADPDLRIPYHDSISLCTEPSRTWTTVEFGYDDDTAVVDGETLEEPLRAGKVLDRVREMSDVDSGAHVESENSFPSNVGLGSSSSGFAALARAACDAAGLQPSLEEVSAVARLGSSSAARSVTGGFSHLHVSDDPTDCVSRRIDDGFDGEIRVVTALVPEYKETSRAHREAEKSPLFRGRMSYVHDDVRRMRRGVRKGSFDDVFPLAERDSLSLLAVTMTGPDNWIYWRPETLELYEIVRDLRETEDVSVYLSTDTGATAYLNTVEEDVDRVVEAVENLGLESRIWTLGGKTHLTEDHLF
ncbi:MAG: diphosphomevalonate decarboxylase [Halobacteria archaeon]